MRRSYIQAYKHTSTHASAMTYHAFEDEDACCWICLDNSKDNDVNPLYLPCKCPRVAHKFCIAKWQLTSGKENCRFCDMKYDHWKTLTSPEVLQPYYNIPTSIRFAFHVKSNEYKIPIQTHPCINIQVVMDTFKMLTGTKYSNVNFVACKVRDPFTMDIITVNGKNGLESTLHFVLIGKAYARFLDHKKRSVWKIPLTSVVRRIQSKVNRFIGSTSKNEVF